MSLRLLDYLFLILLWLILILTLLEKCGHGGGVDVKYIPGDSVPYTVYKDKPVPYTIIKRDTIPLYDTVWEKGNTEYVLIPVDTANILKDYFSQVIYKDTVKNDTSALIVLNETILKNRIKMREVIFQNRRPTAIIEERKNALVFGIGGTLNGVDVSAGYRHKYDVFSVYYSSFGLGVRYQREISVKK